MCIAVVLLRDERQYYVYIMTNVANTVFYTGVTNNIIRRVQEHRDGKDKVFTARYRVTKLVYFDTGGSIEGAILREKQIKAGSRQDKINLIRSLNPGWRDLYEDLVGEAPDHPDETASPGLAVTGKDKGVSPSHA